MIIISQTVMPPHLWGSFLKILHFVWKHHQTCPKNVILNSSVQTALFKKSRSLLIFPLIYSSLVFCHGLQEQNAERNLELCHIKTENLKKKKQNKMSRTLSLDKEKGRVTEETSNKQYNLWSLNTKIIMENNKGTRSNQRE